jgi:hypothetical protein
MAQYVTDSTDVTPNGMEEVIGSIPIRSTDQFNNLDRPTALRPVVCVIVFVIIHRSGAGARIALAEPIAANRTCEYFSALNLRLKVKLSDGVAYDIFAAECDRDECRGHCSKIFSPRAQSRLS